MQIENEKLSIEPLAVQWENTLELQISDKYLGWYLYELKSVEFGWTRRFLLVFVYSSDY